MSGHEQSFFPMTDNLFLYFPSLKGKGSLKNKSLMRDTRKVEGQMKLIDICTLCLHCMHGMIYVIMISLIDYTLDKVQINGS